MSDDMKDGDWCAHQPLDKRLWVSLNESEKAELYIAARTVRLHNALLPPWKAEERVRLEQNARRNAALIELGAPELQRPLARQGRA